MKESILAKIYNRLEQAAIKEKENTYRRRFNIHETARLGYLPHIIFKGNIEMGPNSSFNSGKICTGKKSRVVICEWSRIGHNVNIHAISHDPENPTGPMDQRPAIEGSIIIEDHVWIGSNVFIRPGVRVGRNSVIGANAVVIHDVPENAVVGGIPAKIIRFKGEKHEEKNQGLFKGLRDR